ncbi:hypothetical protein GSH19_04120 [Lactobacillus sp. S2-2]|uniref:GH25 family lysozyme n=1 Tax=Lactobacillus sp. S2-2 TaxID=2692917 RepID=UPI001F35B753|nr:GH25 family lysozyme [Lactobacillus sp. S2-2]MCF6515341.1 hypothetical protein [Lactobacillus sp. S2-2]
MKLKHLFLSLLTLVLFFGISENVKANNTNLSSSNQAITYDYPVYDISEWQGKITDAQAQKLKTEVPFLILRVQYGSSYADKTFQANKAMLEKYDIPYGVYSFSQYEDADDAADEAKTLYQKAPNARFYVNDYEDQTVTSGSTDDATLSWLKEMRKYSGNKKVLLYSYQNFMLKYASKAISSYDGYWLAAYQSTEPTREHVLWQYTSSEYSAALNKKVDASISSSKPISWFLGSGSNNNNENNTNTQEVQFKNVNLKKIIKANTNSNIYDNVPGDTENSSDIVDNSNNYVAKNMKIDQQATNSKNEKYYHISYKGKSIGWISTSAVTRAVTYKKTKQKVRVNAYPTSNFYNHVPGSQLATKKKANGKTYANRVLTVNKVATKDGYKHQYFNCYYRGKLVGWIYGGSLVNK